MAPFTNPLRSLWSRNSAPALATLDGVSETRGQQVRETATQQHANGGLSIGSWPADSMAGPSMAVGSENGRATAFGQQGGQALLYGQQQYSRSPQYGQPLSQYPSHQEGVTQMGMQGFEPVIREPENNGQCQYINAPPQQTPQSVAYQPPRMIPEYDPTNGQVSVPDVQVTANMKQEPAAESTEDYDVFDEFTNQEVHDDESDDETNGQQGDIQDHSSSDVSLVKLEPGEAGVVPIGVLSEAENTSMPSPAPDHRRSSSADSVLGSQGYSYSPARSILTLSGMNPAADTHPLAKQWQQRPHLSGMNMSNVAVQADSNATLFPPQRYPFSMPPGSVPGPQMLNVLSSIEGMPSSSSDKTSPHRRSTVPRQIDQAQGETDDDEPLATRAPHHHSPTLSPGPSVEAHTKTATNPVVDLTSDSSDSDDIEPICWKLPEHEIIYQPVTTASEFPSAKVSVRNLVREEILLSEDHTDQEVQLFTHIFLPAQRALPTPDPAPAHAVLNFHTIAIMVLEAFVQYEIGDELGRGYGFHGGNTTQRPSSPTPDQPRTRSATDADVDEIFFAVVDRWRAGLAAGKESLALIRGCQEFCDVALDVIHWVKEHGLLVQQTKARKERKDKGVVRGPRGGKEPEAKTSKTSKEQKTKQKPGPKRKADAMETQPTTLTSRKKPNTQTQAQKEKAKTPKPKPKSKASKTKIPAPKSKSSGVIIVNRQTQ